MKLFGPLWSEGVVVVPLSSIAHYWNEKDVGFITAQSCHKTGLQKNRWEQIHGPLKFWEGNAADEEKRDEWYRIHQLFNDNMDRIYIAGSILTIDESMSQWLGDEYNVPGITKMKLKSEEVGFLIKI